MTRRRARSWVDLVIAGIDRLPGPAWVAYAVLIVVSIAVPTILRVVGGDEVTALSIAFAGLTFTPVALMHATNRAAGRALAEFRTALGELEPEYDDLERRLTSTSVATGVIGAAIGLGIIIGGTLSVDGGWGVDPDNSFATNVATLVTEAILNVSLAVVLLHQIGQVRTIARIHREATNIELWNVRPHNAFARVTVLVAIALTVLYAAAAAVSAASTVQSGIATVLVAVVLLVATLVFVGPLAGMRRRLVAEKERQLGETDRTSELVSAEIRTAVDLRDFATAASLESVVAALATERDRLAKVSTWPWSADTLRAFITSLGVPILLWLATTLLGRLLFA